MVRARTSSRGHQNSASLKNMKSVIISVKSDIVATDHIIGSDDAMFMPSTEMNDHTSTPRLTLRPIVAAPLLQSLAVGGWEYAGERRADRCILRGRDAARAARGAADARAVCAVIRKCSMCRRTVVVRTSARRGADALRHARARSGRSVDCNSRVGGCGSCGEQQRGADDLCSPRVVWNS